MLKRAYEISQGVKVKEVPLDDLAKSWAKLPRSRAITERHEKECMRRLNKFVEFIQKLAVWGCPKYLPYSQCPKKKRYELTERGLKL